MIYKFCNKWNLPIDEWYDVAAIGLVKAGISYDCDKGYKFSTYAFSVMNNERKNTLRQLFSNSNKVNLEAYHYNETITWNADSEETFIDMLADVSCSVEDEAIVNVDHSSFMDTLCDSHRKIINMYRDGYTPVEIAESVGCSHSNPHMVRKSVRDKMREVL